MSGDSEVVVAVPEGTSVVRRWGFLLDDLPEEIGGGYFAGELLLGDDGALLARPVSSFSSGESLRYRALGPWKLLHRFDPAAGERAVLEWLHERGYQLHEPPPLAVDEQSAEIPLEGAAAAPGAGAATLHRVRLLHTVVWAFFAGCIVALPFVAWRGQFRWVLALIVLVLVEVAVLMLNRWKCPLTAVAGRYTEDRRDNFDIYLPLWLARWNKQIFGSLFVAGMVYAIARWRGWV